MATRTTHTEETANAFRGKRAFDPTTLPGWARWLNWRRSATSPTSRPLKTVAMARARRSDRSLEPRSKRGPCAELIVGGSTAHASCSAAISTRLHCVIAIAKLLPDLKDRRRASTDDAGPDRSRLTARATSMKYVEGHAPAVSRRRVADGWYEPLSLPFAADGIWLARRNGVVDLIRFRSGDLRGKEPADGFPPTLIVEVPS